MRRKDPSHERSRGNRAPGKKKPLRRDGPEKFHSKSTVGHCIEDAVTGHHEGNEHHAPSDRQGDEARERSERAPKDECSQKRVRRATMTERRSVGNAERKGH